ncbi:flagellar biosynthesis anti-sigma factor FlgM [Parageobacillus sp. VR-IP]|uniref:flagellar biosynthesis anti-sigma factor FlgM n=1 Tax=Parageobacillus sp. VR-IP TaxID=2742205 RepID=UPI001583EC30|nr:flagellar biosynthesis anti-sigma factor FlgM [Parageobacillus sp. VR-IP]NUK29774.1 flagellar biosynthesis anti-sigma factor FlgM [Parageobacillus sp. VR-IP]
MRINHFGLTGVNPYRRQFDKEMQAKKPVAKQDQDKVEISAAAKELQQISQSMVEHQEKVRKLKEQVQNGTYQIDAKAIAKSIYKFYFKN